MVYRTLWYPGGHAGCYTLPYGTREGMLGIVLFLCTREGMLGIVHSLLCSPGILVGIHRPPLCSPGILVGIHLSSICLPGILVGIHLSYHGPYYTPRVYHGVHPSPHQHDC